MSKKTLSILAESNDQDSLSCELIESSELESCAINESELALLPHNVSEKRRAQFILGRGAAHRAIEGLGGPNDCIIAKGAKGEPIWPAGYVGSISHTEGAGLAVVGRASEFLGLGTDLELSSRKFDPKILSRIGLPAEGKWIKEQKDEVRLRTLLLFSAKESLYKALFPLVKKQIGFKDVFMRWDDEAQSFIATLLTDLNNEHRAGDLILVQSVIQEPYLMTCAIVPVGEA